jgi:hypothetical protein
MSDTVHCVPAAAREWARRSEHSGVELLEAAFDRPLILPIQPVSR